MNEPLTVLDDCLAREFSLKKEKIEKIFLPFKKRGRHPQYLAVPVKITVGDHFQMKVDRLIFDAGLGTLALVKFVETQSAEALQTQLERKINQTAYLCHLLATDRLDRTADRRGVNLNPEDNTRQAEIPVAVELVLVHPHTWNNKPLAPKINRILTDLHHKNSYLSAIGINVLAYCQDDNGQFIYAQKDLNRAFCWLLDKVHLWLGQIKSAEETQKPLGDILLTNYRSTPHRT